MSVASDCAQIRRVLPVLREALARIGRECVGPRDGGSEQRKWVVGTALQDGRSVRIEVEACGGNAVVVAVAVRDGPLWQEHRRWRRSRGKVGALLYILGTRVPRWVEWIDAQQSVNAHGAMPAVDASGCWVPVAAQLGERGL